MKNTNYFILGLNIIFITCIIIFYLILWFHPFLQKENRKELWNDGYKTGYMEALIDNYTPIEVEYIKTKNSKLKEKFILIGDQNND